MHPTHGPWRVLLSILLVLTVPLCCCNLHAATGHAHRPSPVDGHAAAPGHYSHAHHSGAGHGHGPASTYADGQCSPEPEGDHKCSCGKHDVRMMPGERLGVPMIDCVVLTVVTWTAPPVIEPAAAPPVQFGGHDTPDRPPTALLRMHCALIV
jgi:hypothetical protein